MTSKIKHTPYWVVSILKVGNWHIQWNENLALELSYDLGLGCSHLFYISIDYDSSYPWIRLTYLHLIGVRPVQTYWGKTNVTISLPSPTSDNAMNMSIGISCRWITIVDGFPFDELLVDELHCWWTSCWYTSGGLIWLLSARTKILKCQNQCYTVWFFLTAAPPRPPLKVLSVRLHEKCQIKLPVSPLGSASGTPLSKHLSAKAKSS